MKMKRIHMQYKYAFTFDWAISLASAGTASISRIDVQNFGHR